MNKDEYIQCYRKAVYSSIEEADLVIAEIKKRSKTDMRSYCCTICNKYHLTSKSVRDYFKNYRKSSAYNLAKGVKFKMRTETKVKKMRYEEDI